MYFVKLGNPPSLYNFRLQMSSKTPQVTANPSLAVCSNCVVAAVRLALGPTSHLHGGITTHLVSCRAVGWVDIPTA